MKLSTELLDFIRFQLAEIHAHPEHYSPVSHARALVYRAAEAYRVKHIPLDRREEFYTIVMAAFEDGETEGRRQHALVVEAMKGQL